MKRIMITLLVLVVATCITIGAPLASVNRAKIVQAGVVDNPYDFVDEIVETGIYTNKGERIFRLIGPEYQNILVTKDKQPITIDDGQTTLIATYDEETESYADGANRNLQIFLDSRLGVNYLVSGVRYVTSISLDKEVFLINFKPNKSTSKLIWAFREKIKLNWYDEINPFKKAGEPYRYFDMSGRAIKQEHIGNIKNASLLKTTKIVLNFTIIPGLVKLFTGKDINAISYVDIKEKTILGELINEMRQATKHPWPMLEAENGLPVITTDGNVIYVNPRSSQLCDFFGYALYNSKTGLPIIFYDNDIITTDKKQQNVNENILVDSVTVESLLNSGREFYITTTTTPFGIFDIPVFMSDNGDWLLMNGKSADGIIDNTRLSTDLDGKSLGEWFSDVFDNVFSPIKTLWDVIKIIIFIVVILIVVIAAAIPLVLIYGVFKKASSSTRTKKKGRSNRR